MNMRRFLSLLLCIVMLITCALPLASCKKDKCEHIDGNGDGKCDKCSETVTINCTQHVDANEDNKCDNCGADVTPAPAGKTNYTVSVKSAGGMALVGVNVYVYNADNNIIALPKSTDDNGNVVFTLDTATDYTVYLDGVPEGYNVKQGDTADARYQMGPTGVSIVLNSKPVTDGTLKSNYNVGDVMYDFSITDVDGKVYKLSELLSTKRMVMLNFWYIDCSWCNKEFPGLNDSYQNYSDKLEILAINDYSTDSAVEVKNFPTTGSYEEDNLVFPLFKVTDSNGMTIGKFGGFSAGETGYPTTIIIDRYGVICMIEQGAIVGEAKWNKIFDHFTSDKYTQKLIENAEDLTPPEKPNVEWGGSDGIAENFSQNRDFVLEYYPDEDEYSWPFVTGNEGSIKYVKPSNKSDNSYGILYSKVQLKPGEAVIFDYFSSCEYSNDRLVVIVDNNDICSLTGVNSGSKANADDWEECCAFVDPRPVTESNKNELETYEIAFAYIKDTETSDGDDTVYLKNFRVISVDDIETETYIIRSAVSGLTADNGGYNTYVEYILGDDGYYHVKDANGNAGPLLLVDFLGYTNFDSYKTVSQRIMDAGEIKVGDVDKYYNWMVYANASSNSAIYGFSPITEELKEILVAYCNLYKNEVSKDDHEDLWLQLCTYYDAYGKDKEGNPTKHISDPIKGLTTLSAFETDFKENPDVGDTVTYEVTYDRVIMPRGYLYKFSPKTSGVYRVTSHSDQEMNGWIFTGSSLKWMSSENGDRDTISDFEQEERFCPVLNLDNGDGTFTRDNNNISLLAYMEAGKDYYIDIAYYDIYAEGTFTFDITYEGAEFDAFVMASPGPITYIETATGGIGGLIALGIDYGFKDEGGTLYAYEVIERDEDGNPTAWGNKIYADLYYATIPFPSQSIKELADIGAFNFSISELDRDALIYLEEIRKDGKNAIITKWINGGNTSASTTWTEKELDDILLLVQKGADVSSYPSEDVETAREALRIGELELRKELGIEAIGDSDDWAEYKMDEALAGKLSTDETIKEMQEKVLAAIDKLWNETYKMSDVAKGIYHGKGEDETETIKAYIDAIENNPDFIERQGCVAVTKELSEILSQLYEKYLFEDVKNDWLKFCFYYKHLGA